MENQEILAGVNRTPEESAFESPLHFNVTR